MEHVKRGTCDKQTSREEFKNRFPLITGDSNLYRTQSTTRQNNTIRSITNTKKCSNLQNYKQEAIVSRPHRHPYDSGLPLSRGKSKLKLTPEHENTDFRKLYYKREVTWQRPREPTLFEGVRSFCSYTGLQRSNTEVRSTVPNSQEIKKEQALDRYHEKIRGYSRMGQIDEAVGPSYPFYSTWTKINYKDSEDDLNIESGDQTTSKKQAVLNDFSDYGLVRLYAPFHHWTPSDNVKLLESRRRNALLYSRMYHWYPRPVTYDNFFLPQIHKKL